MTTRTWTTTRGTTTCMTDWALGRDRRPRTAGNCSTNCARVREVRESENTYVRSADTQRSSSSRFISVLVLKRLFTLLTKLFRPRLFKRGRKVLISKFKFRVTTKSEMEIEIHKTIFGTRHLFTWKNLCF